MKIRHNNNYYEPKIFIAGDLSGLGQLYSISLTDFERDILPKLREHDSVIWFDCKGDSTASKSDETQQLHATVEKLVK